MAGITLRARAQAHALRVFLHARSFSSDGSFDLTWSRGMGEKSSSETAPRRTLFVRNLPYSTSDEQLSVVFGKYGSIKSCFTVKDKGALQIERAEHDLTVSLANP